MGFDLIKEGETRRVRVLGETLVVPMLLLGQREKAQSTLLDTLKGEGLTWDELCEYIGGYIKAIEGYDERPAQVLKRLAHIEDAYEIFRACMTLTDQEQKNSSSSPGISSGDSAGTAPITPTTVSDSASATPTPSFSMYEPGTGKDN